MSEKQFDTYVVGWTASLGCLREVSAMCYAELSSLSRVLGWRACALFFYRGWSALARSRGSRLEVRGL